MRREVRGGGSRTARAEWLLQDQLPGWGKNKQRHHMHPCVNEH